MCLLVVCAQAVTVLKSYFRLVLKGMTCCSHSEVLFVLIPLINVFVKLL